MSVYITEALYLYCCAAVNLVALNFVSKLQCTIATNLHISFCLQEVLQVITFPNRDKPNTFLQSAYTITQREREVIVNLKAFVKSR